MRHVAALQGVLKMQLEFLSRPNWIVGYKNREGKTSLAPSSKALF